MYAKIFRQIYGGTLATEGPWEALVTFQQMLILADSEGTVDMTAKAIARETTIPYEIIEKGLTALELPDPESRSPAEGGRRILKLSPGRNWGWRITNYEHYRKLRREEDRRAYHREYWHKRKTNSTDTQHDSTNSPIAEAEAYAKAEAEEETKSVAVATVATNQNWDFVGKVPATKARDPDETVCKVFMHWKTSHNHPRAKLDDKRTRMIRKALENYSEADLCQAISGYLNSPHHMGQNERSTVYDDIELMLKDAKHIDAGLKFYEQPPRTDIGEKTKRIISQTEGWTAPEKRRGCE